MVTRLRGLKRILQVTFDDDNDVRLVLEQHAYRKRPYTTCICVILSTPLLAPKISGEKPSSGI